MGSEYKSKKRSPFFFERVRGKRTRGAGQDNERLHQVRSMPACGYREDLGLNTMPPEKRNRNLAIEWGELWCLLEVK